MLSVEKFRIHAFSKMATVAMMVLAYGHRIQRSPPAGAFSPPVPITPSSSRQAPQKDVSMGASSPPASILSSAQQVPQNDLSRYHVTNVTAARRFGGVSMQATKAPELYVYDHCPFCVRVRLAAGVLKTSHRLVFLENDDVETPSALVGKKIAPIWVDSDGAMPESLDIIQKFDTEKKIRPASDRKDIKDWQKSVQTLMRKLIRPRYVKVPLPEFMKKAGRDAFVNNHQMPPYEKSEWKGNPDFPLEKKYEEYEKALAESPTMLAELNEKMKNLEPLIFSAEACTEGGFSYDDVDLWARLRSLTLIKGLEYPPKVRAYLEHFEKEGDVPLYWTMAV